MSFQVFGILFLWQVIPYKWVRLVRFLYWSLHSFRLFWDFYSAQNFLTLLHKIKEIKGQVFFQLIRASHFDCTLYFYFYPLATYLGIQNKSLSRYFETGLVNRFKDKKFAFLCLHSWVLCNILWRTAKYLNKTFMETSLRVLWHFYSEKHSITLKSGELDNSPRRLTSLILSTIFSISSSPLLPQIDFFLNENVMW